MDSVLITMPETLREFLIALTVVQELQIQMIQGASKNPPLREVNFSITFRLSEKFKYFEPCLQVVNNVVPTFDYSGWNEYSRGEFTNFVDFDFESAKIIAKANQLHITEAFGAKLGTTLNALQFGMYPGKQAILTPLKLLTEDSIKINVIEWDFDMQSGYKLKEYIENNYPDLQVVYSISVKPLCEMDVLFKTVNSYTVVIGCMSEITYIEASLDKALIEIFHTDEDCYLYHNKNLPHYECVVGNPTASYVWYLWEKLWENLSESIQNMKSQEHQTQTQPLVSTVSNVEEKSSDKPDQ